MNFIEAFIFPHPYLFTLICIILIGALHSMVTDRHPSPPSNDNDPADFPQDGM